MRLRRPVDTRVALGVAVVLLVLVNLTLHRWAPGWGLLTTVPAVLGLLAVEYWSGGSRAELGLGAGTLGRGARWALGCTGVVAAGYLLAALLPVTRPLFQDTRNSGLSGADIAFRVLVAVPVGTVLLEELAFRGVLYGLARRRWGRVGATAFSSALFGLWHILPSLHLAGGKPTLAPLFGGSLAGALLADAGAVLFTAAAGVLLCELRRRSDSLLAPAGLHWAVNSLGYLAGFLLR
ncbi:CPBP family intramembrane glutamic endopeptidase [Saccharothrix sp. ST-888]|uniref:CPBP family intramembrane glutamic endopeptidase n=1 Tax=Saccharothrix sp. ST-888 TaxID=1427391 RepID=UPI0005EC87B4|nr:CPBP family intramembrane glutamic endopeptidase [Saccharothrix sp. ST-888]KJK55671.1 CAAX protease [Saccharothrix sp. ST-888]